MDLYLSELCGDSELVVVHSIKESDLSMSTECILKLSPLGKMQVAIPYFKASPRKKEYERVNHMRKQALEKLLSKLKLLGYGYRQEAYDSILLGKTSYIILTRERDESRNRVLLGMVDHAVSRRHLTPIHIEIKRGFSYLEIDIATLEPLSRIKAMHIQSEVETALYCKANMDKLEDHSVRISAREIEPRHVNCYALYDALDWRDDDKVLYGIDIDNNPISVDIAGNQKILCFHGEGHCRNSISRLFHNRKLCYYSEDLSLGKDAIPIELFDSLNPKKGTIIAVTFTSNLYSYSPSLMKVLEGLLARKDITLIVETCASRILTNLLDRFDYKVFTGLNSSLEARHLAAFCGAFNNHFYDSTDILIHTHDGKTTRAEYLN